MTIMNLETRANGLVQSFDVVGVFKKECFPYKHAVAYDLCTGYLLKLSGMLGVDEKGELAKDPNDFMAVAIAGRNDLYSQTVTALENIEKVIHAAIEHYFSSLFVPEGGLKYVVSTRVDVKFVVVDPTRFKSINDAYHSKGLSHASRTMVGVALLPLGAEVEITAEAFISKSKESYKPPGQMRI